MRALVIDDSQTMRTILRFHLEEAGFKVLEAANGVEALKCIEQEMPLDVVMVDLHMPGMSGMELIREARGKKRYEDLVIMMVSTDVDMKQISAALDAGANEYLMKPFSKEALLEKLSMLGIVGGKHA